MAYLDDNGLLYLWNKIKTLVTNAISNKVDKVPGKGLSTNDYTTAEKDKLAGVASGAEVNQNAFSHVLVGGTTLSADQKLDVLTLEAGSNITLTPDAATDKVTISSTNTTYNPATGSAAGLMSAADKTKLDGVASSANNYVHPTGQGYNHIPSGGYTGYYLKWLSNGAAEWQPVTKATVGLGDVDNTSDAEKPVSTLVQTALDGKLPYIEHGPAGIPTADRIDTLPIGIHTYSTGVIITSESHQVKFDMGNGKPIATRQKNNNVWLPWQETAMFTSENKNKLFGIAEKANNYVHPDTHPASMIIQSDYYKFVSTQQINLWNSSASPATPSQNGQMAKEDKAKLDAFGPASTYALKADIVGMYKYKGSVADASKLPTTGQTTGDVYNIVAPSIYGAASANVAWDGSKWDSLGEIFTITSITNAQIDTICA